VEQPVVCTKCKKRFIVAGTVGNSKIVSQLVTCPYCSEPNDVNWPMGDGWKIIKG
jgi:hypothetical protein